ncbi:MAG: dephospho-CoA kinase [Erysipelotrichaceae bacterium]|nr:dephospho-CoA kinase [Erysipelotrichaceae bacterium]
MKVAVSGSIGSGKSVVCEYLVQKGYAVFSCDEVNRHLLDKGEEGYLKVKEIFPECFSEDELDRKKLAELIFADEEKRKILECIMHPLILKRLQERKEDPLFAEVPLLFETGWDEYFDHNLLIVTDLDLLIERVGERGMSKDELLKRLDAQMSVEEKAKRADKIIYNNGSLEQLYSYVEEWLKEIIC